MSDETADLSSVLERLKRLEQQNSRFKTLITISILAALIALLSPCLSSPICRLFRIPKVLEAQRIILRNEEGVARIEMISGIGARDPLGTAGITVNDSNGMPAVNLVAGEGGGSFGVEKWDVKPKPHVQAGISVTPHAMILSGDRGSSTVSVLRSNEGALQLGTSESEKFLTLTLSASEPPLVLARKGGEIIWSAP